MTTVTVQTLYKSCGKSHGKEHLKRKALRGPWKADGVQTWNVGRDCSMYGEQQQERSDHRRCTVVCRKLELNDIALHDTPFQSYRVSLAMWDHTMLPSTLQKWTHPALTPGRQADTWFTYPRGMDWKLSWPTWLATHSDGLPAHRQSPT